MIKKIFSAFLNILLKIFQLKAFFYLLKRYKIFILLGFLLILVGLFLWIRTLNLSDVLTYKEQLFYFIEKNPILTAGSFFLIYLIVSIFSLPGTAVLGVIGGFLFGFIQGLFFSIVSVTLGSSVAFLITRRFFKKWFLKKAGSKINKILKYLHEDEIYYLFAFRLFPFIPFFVTNIFMALSSMSFKLFFIISFIALLPLLAIYVNIGSQLSQLEDWKGFSDPYLLSAFTLVGLFPLIVKYTFKFVKNFKKSRQELVLDSDTIF